MGKYTLEIESRHIYSGPKEKNFSELFEFVAPVEFSDDAESGNDFDIELKSDASRYKETVDITTDLKSSYFQKGTLVSGSRSGANEFTRSSGTWTADSLSGYMAWIETYPETGGAWYLVTGNTTTKLTLSTDFGAGCDTCYLSAVPLVRNNIHIVCRPGFYGSFYKYKVTKKMPSSGDFKFFGVEMNAIPINMEPEFFASTGAASAGWE